MPAAAGLRAKAFRRRIIGGLCHAGAVNPAWSYLRPMENRRGLSERTLARSPLAGFSFVLELIRRRASLAALSANQHQTPWDMGNLQSPAAAGLWESAGHRDRSVLTFCKLVKSVL